jgi:hypothetical protein
MDALAGTACPAMNAAPARLSHAAHGEPAFRAKMARRRRRTINPRKASPLVAEALSPGESQTRD